VHRSPEVSRIVVVLLCAFAARGADAQVDRVLPTTLNLSTLDCESDEETLIQWTGYQKPDAYFLGVRLEERGVNTTACPTFGVQSPLHVVEEFADTLFSPTNGTLFVERRYTGSDVLGALCTTGARREALLCVYGSSFTNTPATNVDIDLVMTPLVVTLDTLVPDAPSIEKIAPGEQRLIVSFDDVDTSLGDSYTYVVQYRLCPSADETDAGTLDDAGVLVEEAESLCDSEEPFRQTSGSSSPVTVTGLVNGREVEVRVVVVDDFGNESLPSEAELATPLGERTPLSVYDGTENPFSIEGPECGTSAQVHADIDGAMMAALGLLAIGALRAARRKIRGGASR